jgi:hypothetical protein
VNDRLIHVQRGAVHAFIVGASPTGKRSNSRPQRLQSGKGAGVDGGRRRVPQAHDH